MELLKIALRVLIIYAVLAVAMRIMGKRQLGELEVSELITTFMLSEIATAPITSPEKNILSAIVAIFTLLLLELIVSFVLIKLPSIRTFISPKPTVLINKGTINQKELGRQRLTNDELLGSLRQMGYTDVSEIYYVIMEGNGKLTVVPKATNRQPTTQELGLDVKERGIQHILISDGHVDKNGLKTLNLSKKDLDKILKEMNCTEKDVFLLTCNESGEKRIVMRQKK